MSKLFYNGHVSSSWVFPLIFLFTQPTTGKAAGLAAEHNAGSEIARPSLEATPTDKAPKLDGTLNDPLWQLASPVTDFRQREPDEGQPSTEKTEVRILYTRHAVYFGIRCYDSAASRIVATELRRDVSQELDDHFEVLIDSNRDRRGAHSVLKTTGSSLKSKEVQMEGTLIAAGTECGPHRRASLPRDGPQQ
jgi:hypothetical protein